MMAPRPPPMRPPARVPSVRVRVWSFLMLVQLARNATAVRAAEVRIREVVMAGGIRGSFSGRDCRRSWQEGKKQIPECLVLKAEHPGFATRAHGNARRGWVT